MNARGGTARIKRGLSRVRAAGSARVESSRLEERVSELEAEVQECRQLNLRLAELTDLVQELLLPVAQRDEARVAELTERYTTELG
ncbi:DUF6752 domain-containing protein [Nocardioides donggukensis]|uniref:DUF6752 domain-containing protein n=1 Tax=Nocardioides donggukensis TaxID=2774019 RepID=A0A927Q070_9ACTN|nr:DUF6752 domain-containing protein [Nocardioides donggukensis]MBD8870255.1 hypothetical protein [Nocardioides donggukensis]